MLCVNLLITSVSLCSAVAPSRKEVDRNLSFSERRERERERRQRFPSLFLSHRSSILIMLRQVSVDNSQQHHAYAWCPQQQRSRDTMRRWRANERRRRREAIHRSMQAARRIIQRNNGACTRKRGGTARKERGRMSENSAAARVTYRLPLLHLLHLRSSSTSSHHRQSRHVDSTSSSHTLKCISSLFLCCVFSLPHLYPCSHAEPHGQSTLNSAQLNSDSFDSIQQQIISKRRLTRRNNTMNYGTILTFNRYL